MRQIDYHIILASKSPRRKELLEKTGLKFRVQAIDIEESYPADLAPEEIAGYLAEQKAKAFPHIEPNTLIITADTIVILEDEILGKPTDKNDAFNMLRKLSGNVHKVITGVCLSSDSKKHSFQEITSVHFKGLSDQDINYYIENYQPFDKAGAYGIQEWIGYIGIEKIEGCFYNVVGLPVKRLYEELLVF